MLRRFCAMLAGGIALALTCLSSRADILLTEGTDFGVDVSPVDGSIAMDLLDSLWLLPANGGQAKQLTDGLIPVTAPRWSPDGASILYQVRAASGSEIWQLNVRSAESRRISNSDFHDQNASWHPHGERIIYASDRNVSGLDIWETDLPTGLSWRITDHPGDETEPAWSRNGHHLAYIRKTEDQYVLVLRRRGEPDQDLVVSDTPLTAPSWRPDGSLLTFLRHREGSTSLEMVILSDPPLARVLVAGENHFSSPVSWRDRSQLVYTADGRIKTRGIDERQSRSLPFRAVVRENAAPTPRTIPNRELAVSNPPTGRIVIRGARLFDGIWPGYREQMDVLIDKGLIVAVAPRQDWDDATILDLGNVTLLPGLIDSWSASPDNLDDGPALLAYGITTIVSESDDNTMDLAAWEGEAIPGPRILPAAIVTATTKTPDSATDYLVKLMPAEANDADTRTAVQTWRDLGVPVVAESWITSQRMGADILLGIDTMPSVSQSNVAQPLQDARQKGGSVPPILISGLADAGTPGIAELLDSRQAKVLGQTTRPGRRFAGMRQLAATPAMIVAGSEPNGLAPGLALHAELRALRAAGLNGEQTLYTASKNAALMLGLDDQIGTITPGAMADLILVAGDPLRNVQDLLKIVAVVRNGRFFSLVSLLERVRSSPNVE